MSNKRTETELSPFKTIQIHPSRKCNLSCLHCYSSSSPHFTQMLDIEELKTFLVYAKEQGYNNISLSGGEPFLYKNLEELLVFSKSLGFQNAVASNGMLLQSEKNQRILEYIDIIAISIDGKKELHDKIRGQIGAFEKMLKGIEILNKHDKNFGFIHTITPESWEDLIWLGDFAFGHNAKLLQLHPLEMYGRAIEELQDSWLNDTLAYKAFILSNYLTDKYQSKMIVQLDLLHKEYLKDFPEIVNPFHKTIPAATKISDYFDTIIVDDSGKIIPIAYGFNQEYCLGNIREFKEDAFEEYINKKIPVLEKLYSDTLTKVFSEAENEVFNWNEIIVHESLAI